MNGITTQSLAGDDLERGDPGKRFEAIFQSTVS
jgi:hypothetical protein